MVSHDDAPDFGAVERDAIRTDLVNALGLITGQTEVLRQQVLRANGLIDLERDQILGGLAFLRAETKRMGDRVDPLDGGDESTRRGPAPTDPQVRLPGAASALHRRSAHDPDSWPG